MSTRAVQRDLFAAQLPFGSRLGSSSGSIAELVVQLEPTDLGEVVALRIEEQVVEQVRRGIDASADHPAEGAGRSR